MTSTTTHRTGRNLPAAIATGLVLGLVILVTLLWWNWGFVIFASAALTVGVWEVCRALDACDMHTARWPLIIGSPIVLVGCYAAGQLIGQPQDAMWIITGGLAIMMIISLFMRIPGGVQGFVKDVAASAFVIGYLPLLGSSIVLMLASPHGAGRILCFIVCPIACDTGAYAFGSLFGRHKMAPSISPAKSWEGFVGGIVLAMVVAAIVTHLVLGAPIWVGVLLGLVAGCCGVLGDLVESAIKRDAGLKDMSHVLPGHGGVMDRLDSMLVAAPAAWLVLYLLVV
ncbi:phosphatidate cytidylyltransferase [Propionibacterium sp.]|uniref:phosphatidate cytidylyltransferase n=1 Tax=Propionibacterium sp. TaxID=1977903 RepID=UPI0039EC3C1C